jgi:hypothetical protein
MPIPNSFSGKTALDVAVEAARRAGEVLRSRFHGPREVRFKGPSNPVTDADLLAEKSCLELLRGEYPDFGIGWWLVHGAMLAVLGAMFVQRMGWLRRSPPER